MTLISDETASSSTSFECESMEEIPRSNNNNAKKHFKARSVSFAPTVDEIAIPSRTSPLYEYRRQDFLDALVDSYKIQTAVHLAASQPVFDEKKYQPKTSRTRVNAQWREHRLRHLMNKLEELALWDREEELKVSQAQFLREQKLEQIADRHRNQDLCLHLMRQRHESEMESAVLLDRLASGINDEAAKSSIAQARRLQHSLSLSSIPSAVQRQKATEKTSIVQPKTPIGRFRHFETTMNDKLEKINAKCPSTRPGRHSFTSIPANVVPLFGETYVALLNLPDTYSANKYHQYRQAPHASSPDYETRRRAYSNRDVRVPLKDHIDDEEEDERRRRRTTHHKVHERSLTEDLETLTMYSSEATKKRLPDIPESPPMERKHWLNTSSFHHPGRNEGKLKSHPEILA